MGLFVKRLGCCTLCDEPVFEIVETMKVDGIDMPKVLGKPLDTARRVHLILTGGTNMALTFCTDCSVTPETLPEIYRKVRLAWALEATNSTRTQIGGDEQSLARQWQIGAHQTGLTNNVPIGVLYEESMQDAMAMESLR